jgi:hypothetical protein
MAKYWAFAADRWGGGEQAIDSILTMQNANAEKTSDVTKRTNDTQVIRKIAIMEAFQTYLAVEQYQQQLRMEALQAALLSIEVNPLD